MSGFDAPADSQLGFEGLLEAADAQNDARRFERETAHLPSTMDEALPVYRSLTAQHHAAMLAADVAETMRLREEADRLALRLNGGEPGILAGPDATGCVLTRETAAPSGDLPLWGQSGNFFVDVEGMNVRIELEGMFCLAGGIFFWPGFSAHAVDPDALFMSPTGFRSFVGLHAPAVPDLPPDEFVRRVICSYVADELNGRLVSIEARYRDKA